MAMRSPAQRPMMSSPGGPSLSRSPPPRAFGIAAVSNTNAWPTPGLASCSHSFRPEASLCGSRYSILSRLTGFQYWPMSALRHLQRALQRAVLDLIAETEPRLVQARASVARGQRVVDVEG